MAKKYVAFLRGVNLGKRNMKMDALREVFLSLGFGGVQSVVASGNVLFEAETTPDSDEISKALFADFGFEVGVILRSIEQLEALIDLNPFGACGDLTDVKLYHTLSAQNIAGTLDDAKDQPGDYSIVSIQPMDFFCVAFRQPNGRYGGGLDKLERLFKNGLISTRNWNTILKIVKKAVEK